MRSDQRKGDQLRRTPAGSETSGLYRARQTPYGKRAHMLSLKGVGTHRYASDASTRVRQAIQYLLGPGS